MQSIQSYLIKHLHRVAKTRAMHRNLLDLLGFDTSATFLDLPARWKLTSKLQAVTKDSLNDMTPGTKILSDLFNSRTSTCSFVPGALVINYM